MGGPHSLLTFLTSYPPSRSLHTRRAYPAPETTRKVASHEVWHQPSHSHSTQPELCSAFKPRRAALREDFNRAVQGPEPPSERHTAPSFQRHLYPTSSHPFPLTSVSPHLFIYTAFSCPTVEQQAPDKVTLRKADDAVPGQESTLRTDLKLDLARETKNAVKKPIGLAPVPCHPQNSNEHAMVIALFSWELQTFPGVY